MITYGILFSLFQGFYPQGNLFFFDGKLVFWFKFYVGIWGRDVNDFMTFYLGNRCSCKMRAFKNENKGLKTHSCR